MNKLFILILFLFQILAVNGQDIEEKIDLLMTSLNRNGVFNGVVLVASHDKIIYKKALGLADRELNVPLTIDSKFKIASLSKPFTALAILQLVQQGKIKFEGTIKDYIPDYSGPHGDSITIHMLLTHTSGIRNSLDIKEEEIKQRLHHELRDVVKYAEKEDLVSKPGDKFSYSNFAYNILAYIIQQVSGKPFEIYLKENIFDIAGMKNTCQYSNFIVEKNLAKGYEYKLLYGFQNAVFVDASITAGSGGLISTADELYHFNKILYSEILLNQKYKNAIFKPYQPGNYGYGWFISSMKIPGRTESLTIADHAGSIDGFGSYMARILTDSSFVVVLKNQRADTYIDPAFAPDIGKKIIDILYGNEIEFPKKSIANHIALIIGTNGIDSAIAEYYTIIKNEQGNYNLEEQELNKLGIELIFRFNLLDEAIHIFRLNMVQFPKSYNTYDSYAYALMKKGDYRNSIKSYKKGLDVLNKNPESNMFGSVKKDAEKALEYIKEMEEKLK